MSSRIGQWVCIQKRVASRQGPYPVEPGYHVFVWLVVVAVAAAAAAAAAVVAARF